MDSQVTVNINQNLMVNFHWKISFWRWFNKNHKNQGWIYLRDQALILNFKNAHIGYQDQVLVQTAGLLIIETYKSN